MTSRILVCDDELHIRRAAEFKFKRAGHVVDCAGDGVEAWERLQQHRPDILVTDYQMPRMDGMELVQRIAADPRLSGLPIVMLTAKGFEISREELKERYGVLEVLSKPFSPRDLLNRIEHLLAIYTRPAAAPADERAGLVGLAGSFNP